MGCMRTYGDACGMARALDRVGERWALMIVRELLLGPKRFTDIREGLPHLSPDVLAQRLRELEETGVVRRRILLPPAASRVYELTEWGRELEPVLIALGRWGACAPSPPEDVGMSLDAHIVSLRTLFDPVAAGDLRASIELRLGQQRFRVSIAAGQLEVERGAAPAPDAAIETDPTTLIQVLHGHRALAAAQRAGDLTIEGDRRVVTRFARLFPLPEPAVA
ncbi:MAG: winged helix-turn-helix transcriptional regulator [Conexibacter sp.]